MDATSKKEKPLNPRSKANIFEIITFSWIIKLIRVGSKKELDTYDLYRVLDEDSAALIGKKLENLWNNELINAEKKNQKPSFLKALFQMFGAKFFYTGIFLTISEIVLSIGLSICVGQLVIHFDTNKADNQSNRGIYAAACLITFCLLKAIILNNYSMTNAHLGMKMRTATCNLIYKKALRLKTNSIDQNLVGRVINLMANDVNRFDVTILYVPFLWIGPLETIIVTYFLWREVGASSICGVATLLIFIPLQVWLGSKSSEIRLKTANKTDERVHLMSEIISGLQIIKMYTWEKFFVNLIEHARKKEVDKIIQSAFVKGILTSFSLFNSRVALFVNLFVYVLLGNYVTASKVFVVTSFYNILRISMTLVFPTALSQVAELLVSIKRIEDFLFCGEKERQDIEPTKESIVIAKSKNIITSNVNNENGTDQLYDKNIVVSNATAKWSDNQNDNSLENINFTVKPGQLVAMIGPIGAGKSSLLKAILKELPLAKGNISVRGTVSYASQEPWLFSGSVQQNILFGLPMDEERYRKIIKVCALKTDFEQFSYGDRTIVGEKGVSLSGGQKARINLARAIYKQADIYLLDDPLSAVDTHVGKHLFEKCIKEYLKEKTRLLVTHQTQYLTTVDKIILVDNANILAEGSYKELQTSTIDFTNLIGSLTETAVSPADDSVAKNAANPEKISVLRNRQLSVSSAASSVEENKIATVQTEPVETDETRSFGSVGLNIYASYFSAGGNCIKIIFLLLVSVLTQVLASGGDFWITFWVNLEDHVFRSIEPLVSEGKNNGTNFDSSNVSMPWIVSRNTCIVVFAVLTFSIIITALTQSFLMVSLCTTASINLHNRMFKSIIRATMKFLNENPSGRILNRFSKDLGLIDEMLPTSLVIVLQIGLVVLGILSVVAIFNPYLIPPMIIIVITFCKLRKIYVSTSRNIKRIEGITRSPMFTHVNASLNGLTTIRAFQVEQILCEEFAGHQDLHSSAWFLFIALARAFGFWLDIACLLFISIITISFLIMGNDTYGGNVGLAITQAVGLTGMFQWAMRQSAELENHMTSVERVLEYTNIPEESDLESTPDNKPPIEWPDKGEIVFSDFCLRYDMNAPFVLKNLNVKIESGEKVGIVGRTGAGKSSLIAALFRLAFNKGSIIIDNKDIHELSLHDLRSNISIIPQEPVLFSGTIRKNLDPFGQYPDHILWNAFEEVELKGVVENLPDGLNSKLFGGSNFSVGQRQLVCLARAIVRNNKILVLDEATANVDPQTDALIQNTIRKKFRMCTVLTIAHRLNTVIDSDKILVMDAGTMVEFDRPYNLLKNKDGFLYKMVEQTVQINIDSLHKIAAEKSE